MAPVEEEKNSGEAEETKERKNEKKQINKIIGKEKKARKEENEKIDGERIREKEKENENEKNENSQLICLFVPV